MGRQIALPRGYETAFCIQRTGLEYDKISTNDHIADAGLDLDLKELVEGAPKSDSDAGLYNAQEAGIKGLLRRWSTANGVPWETKHSSVI